MRQYNCSKKKFTGRAKKIQITSFRINGVLLYFSSRVSFSTVEPIFPWGFKYVHADGTGA